MAKIRVTVWNENLHECAEGAFGDLIRGFYPNGIHNALKEELDADDLEITAVSLDMPGQGMTDELVKNTDVLVWWGHCAHDKVSDELVTKLQYRVLEGMGLIVLHSGHYSKIFRRLMGTSCSLRWRECGEKERLWVIDPQHPIAKDVPETFVVPNTEMYGEPFGIPEDGHVVFISWYEGGNVFRSGVTFRRGAGKVFYFSPGHETFPIYRNKDVVKVIGNAVRWASPDYPPQKTDCWNMDPVTEKVSTVNPLDNIDTTELHKSV